MSYAIPSAVPPSGSNFDPLLPRIEAHLLDHSMSASGFGYMSCGDPSLVLKMRQGRILKGVRRRVVAYLDKVELVEVRA